MPPNFLTGFLVFLLPIPILRQLKSLGRRQKVGLAVVLGIGIITMIVSTGRFITMMFTGNNISICEHTPVSGYTTSLLPT